MSNPVRILAGFGAWAAAFVAYALCVYLTMGKPDPAYLETPAGQFRYETAPYWLLVIAGALLALGLFLFGLAIYSKLTHRG
jgi:hypothetical protein